MKKFIKPIAVTAAIMVALFGTKHHDVKAKTLDFLKLNKATTASVSEPQSFSIVNLLTLKCM